MDPIQYNFGTKVCKTCAVTKPTYEFYLHQQRGRKKAHLVGNCKSCDALRHGAYRKTPAGREAKRAAFAMARKSADWRRRYWEAALKCRYGIDAHDWANMFNAQERQCGICASTLRAEDVHVDHDHETGRVRGLLCAGCNTGLGALERFARFGMQKAFEYLATPRAKGMK
jgi:hypothetical protein